ncbi:MAG: MBL fold metallo-hydrolase [Betaproteobacteria bacterium]
MRLVLYGGFSEKGRTCLGIESGGYRLLLDAGVKTSARGRDYYPVISPAALRATDAIVMTHAHEDHLGALGWCIAEGFRGRIFMTPECRCEADQCLRNYAQPEHVALVNHANLERLPVGPRALELGPLRIDTGRSGHVAGGLWCVVDDGQVSFSYCGDVVPASPVFTMDPLPACHAIALDASYGDDAVAAPVRAAQVTQWIAAHPKGCVLPTPLYGRSVELLGIVAGPVALAPGMREALRIQIDGGDWLAAGAAEMLAARLATATDWRSHTALPPAALLCHDGMGMAGPTRAILDVASAQRHPTLYTGHLPTGSPGERMVEGGLADWIRLPTHPTLTENMAMVAACGAQTVLGHSCDHAVLSRLAPHLPSLRADLATGDAIDL